MRKKIPRLKSAKPVRGTLSLNAVWDDGYEAAVDLTGVIARSTGLNVLSDPKNFARVRLVDWGAGIAWPHPDRPDGFDEDARDRLDYSSSALREIAELQEPMNARKFIRWQRIHSLSNAETACLLDVSPRTVDNYRSGAPIPTSVQIVCVTANNHPEILAAYYKPSAPRGRPKKQTEAA